ncbi:beta-ketoacyl-[acyl-carrier-protein] synthase family protein [Dinghuibacter silviterrae]|uniref:3-oxoacyl-[acyl-carrier-protein] synthase 1 n=1 Tax=Dinghuibacter silviterrae TaxID=1539049 RepID=A0A4R8DV50_9BACT|nr:beta-ketoacyl-[acyl-carrier-protein] synthase family protein [Dinghuibacter silviterrae]TDX01345.1 3-oxoacyl-(acyl-carrier-protein) synthase [Dinghuibacter silviterrae]
MKKRRVVVTGLGVVSPNGKDVPSFLEAIRSGTSGLRYMPEFEQLKYLCQVTGRPPFDWEHLKDFIPEVTFHGLRGMGIGYGLQAAAEAWNDAGLIMETEQPRWDTGIVFGNSTADSALMANVMQKVDALEAKKLGSRVVEQTMNSGVTAYITGRLGLANKIVTNSAACATGSQALLMGYEYIAHGLADRMIAGSTEYVDTYIFGAFDAMRVLSRKFNREPEKASRPMSRTAGGFVPSSGAGALILEDMDTALARGARIYAEFKGGATNSGGQRGGGSMTAPNAEGVVRCIREALRATETDPASIDLISGHLTATLGDLPEIQNWILALDRKETNFPWVNSLKSMIGHCLSAAGSIESVATVLQIHHQFIHPTINLEDPNPEIVKRIDMERIPTTSLPARINTVAKANFGFGDVNACLIFTKWNEHG